VSKVMEKLRAKTQYQLTICYVGFSGLVTPKIVNRLLEAVWLKAILNDLALSGGFDVLRSTHQGSLIVCQVSAGVLTQPTPTLPPTLPARADLASSVGWVRRALRSRSTVTGSNAP